MEYKFKSYSTFTNNGYYKTMYFIQRFVLNTIIYVLKCNEFNVQSENK